MEVKKVEETRALVCEARDLLRRELHAAATTTAAATAPHAALTAEAHAALRGTLQQLLPCLCVLRSFERQHAYASTYELVISAVGQVLGFLAAEDTTASTEAGQPNEPVTQQQPNTVEKEAGDVLPSPRNAQAPPSTGVTWATTFGCEDAILALRQATTLPLRYPALFTGARQPWRRLLLYGPPGTGKSRLAAATAAECGAAFLSVSAADLLSKWVGESEKQVRQAFAQAAAATPRCVLFFDEVDALCGARGGHGESELARRLKTEFLLHLQVELPTVTVLAATNLPWELDAAIVRRFDRFVHVGLPSTAVKRQLLSTELRGVAHTVDDDALDRVVAQTERFSVVDVRRLLAHAVMAPVTEWLLRKDVEGDERGGHAGEEGTGGSPMPLTAATAPAPCLGPRVGRIASSGQQSHRRLSISPPRSTVEVLGGAVHSDSSVASESPSHTCAPLRGERARSGPSSRVAVQEVPCVEARHFEDALEVVTATTTVEELARYTAWHSRATALG